MLQPGDTIDIWVVEAALGTGGMGSVYRCRNRSASRILAAIKVLEGGLRRYPEAEARFVREAEILFQLDHPNIVKVRNIRTETDPPYLEMEFVAGEPLDERLRRGPVPFPEAVGIVRQAAEAVRYLHERGIRHRDIKPANVLVQKDGRVKLVDFGLAVEADHTRITQQGMAFGTVSYAPPEWITPDAMDPTKWDIYALGTVFYELVTGTFAFPVTGQGTARQQAMQVIVAKQGHAPLDPGDAFHDDVRKLIGEMTHADPALRPASMADVCSRLARLKLDLRKASTTIAPTDDNPFGPADSASSDLLEQPSDVLPLVVAPVPKPRPAVDTTTPVTLPGARLASMALAFGGAGAFLVGLFAVLGASALAAWLWTRGSEPRAVQVVAAGLPADAALDVILTRDGDDGRVVLAAMGDAGSWRFSSVPVGAAKVAWAGGEGCRAEECASGACPAWCTSGSSALEVVAGEEPLVVTIEAAVPTARSVAVALPAAGAGPVTATLGAVAGAYADGKLVFDGVMPGRWPLAVVVGDCPAGEATCRANVELVVPLTGEPAPASFAVAPPADGAPAPAPGSPQPAPTAPRRAGALVTHAALTAFLALHPEFAKYYDPTDDKHAIGVAGGLAEEYCSTLGGLATSDSSPLTRPEMAEMEFRSRSTKDSATVLLEITPDNTVRAIPFARWSPTPLAGFRCRRSGTPAPSPSNE